MTKGYFIDLDTYAPRLEILSIGECRGTSKVPNKMILSKGRFELAGSGPFSFEKFSFPTNLLNKRGEIVRVINGTLEIKEIDCSKECFVSIYDNPEQGDKFIMGGFLNVDVYDFYYGPNVRPQEITFVTRCLCDLKI